MLRIAEDLSLFSREKGKMKITIFAAGSQGDIQPCAALAIGLQDAGYHVRLAVPETFSDFVQRLNLEISPLRGDVRKIMASDFGRDFIETGGSNPLKTINAMRTMIAPVVKDMVHDAYEACRGADALISLGVFSPFGQSISEALRLPLINVEPTPLLPTGAFPAPSWPIQRDLGTIHNNFSGIAMLYSIWLWYRSFVNDFRKSHGLPAGSAGYFYRALRSTPMLSAYSPTIIPHPVDWPESVHITGDFHLKSPVDWMPPKELQSYLDAGIPPVYIGFGSISGSKSEELLDIVMEALEKSGLRGILLTGWGGIHSRVKSDNVFVVDSVPHSWLFPKMAAIVHHGGAGTTAEGLRAGVPAVIIPFAFDQFFWGKRINALGLGPAPIPRKKLTADRLANAIRIAVTDPAIKQRAADCGMAVRSEDGVGNAVKVIRQYFGDPD
jgi:UDP:flavonoid glycosyltransferase YjiC (YdhE family)